MAKGNGHDIHLCVCCVTTCVQSRLLESNAQVSRVSLLFITPQHRELTAVTWDSRVRPRHQRPAATEATTPRLALRRNPRVLAALAVSLDTVGYCVEMPPKTGALPFSCPPCSSPPCARKLRNRALFVCAALLFARWGAQDAWETHFVAGRLASALTATVHFLTRPLYSPDASLSAAGCASTFNGSDPASWGPRGPTLWLWWTPPTGATSATPGDDPSAWMLSECFLSAGRHAGIPVAVVNSSATRGAGAPYPLHRFPLPPYFDDLPWNHQGDFGSFALLAEYGGVYLDTDMLVLHSLAPYLARLDRFEFVGFGGHSYDAGVHHGMMAARPRSYLLERVYLAALAAYEAEGGCAGSTCTRKSHLRWLTTLDAFSREARALRREGPRRRCAYARLPTRFFEPGMGEHQSLCTPALEGVFSAAGWTPPAAPNDTTGVGGAEAAPAPQDHAFVVATMQAAHSGSLRLVHLSPSKGEYATRYPGHALVPLLQHCPLVGYLLNVSTGVDDVGLLRRVAAGGVDAWEQRVYEVMP